ncbi:MAG TPA: DnaJ domain-containing protein [Rhodoglobus sp.]|nr:DnaJ domain-containing protein [Rhodoglobus sp.]
MPESPLSSSPYEVLGVPPTASEDDLRKAFRRALRESHPDTGGDPARFVAVQLAWEAIGDPGRRADFDRGGTASSYEPVGPRARQDTRPKARSYGHPGGWRREKYLRLLREWVGRGVELHDPYDAALVRSAPREIRRTLADALAEEATARSLASLGIGYTVWHDVSTGDPERKLDHVVLGPTGLFAMLSEDFGGPVGIRKGELIGEAVAGERPVHELAERARYLSRRLRVKFTGLAVVLPDDALTTPLEALGTVRGMPGVAVRQEHLAALLRGGLAGSKPIGGNELFDVRTRLGDGIRFV